MAAFAVLTAFAAALSATVLHYAFPHAADIDDREPQAANPSNVQEEAAPAAPTPSLTPPPAPATTTYSLQPPYDVVSATTFRQGTQSYRLARVRGPEAAAVCLDASRRPWACGLRARAAFANLVRGRSLDCTGSTGPGGEHVVTCRVDDLDLGTLLVEAGFALPAERPATGAEERAMERARRSTAGLWDGGWTFRE